MRSDLYAAGVTLYHLLALERGERSAVTPPPRTPLVAYAQRVPWRSIAAISLVLNLLLLYVLLVR